MKTIQVPFRLVISTTNDSLFEIMKTVDLSKLEYFKDSQKSITLDQFITSFYYDNIKIKEMIFDGSGQEIKLKKKNLDREFLDEVKGSFEAQVKIQK